MNKGKKGVARGEDMFDASVYQTHLGIAGFHDMCRSLWECTSEAEPTRCHHMLSDMALQGRLMRLYTQNIDSLDTRLPALSTDIPWKAKKRCPKTVQLHGCLQVTRCLKCNALDTFDPVRYHGETLPECPVCVTREKLRGENGQRVRAPGGCRPRTVLYHEQHPDDVEITKTMNNDLRSQPRTLLVMGTSLRIPGVQAMIIAFTEIVRKNKGVSAYLNRDSPPAKMRKYFDLVVLDESENVARLVEKKHRLTKPRR